LAKGQYCLENMALMMFVRLNTAPISTQSRFHSGAISTPAFALGGQPHYCCAAAQPDVAAFGKGLL
jgi:hypothetical protein